MSPLTTSLLLSSSSSLKWSATSCLYVWIAKYVCPNAGVITNEEFAIFQNAGYMGLYGGLDVDDIQTKMLLDQC